MLIYSIVHFDSADSGRRIGRVGKGNGVSPPPMGGG